MMGLSRGTIKLLMKEGKREKYSGSLLTIGRQGIWVKNARDIEKWAEEMDFRLNPDTEISFPVTDTILFSSMGFDSIDSLDYSNYEQCTITHDLNKDAPPGLYNRFDLIFDGGSSEHIFNLPKVLENYNRILKVGGRIIHSLPSSNHVDHGFYMFSPTLLWDYYSSNNWEIKDSLFFRYTRNHYRGLWEIYEYTPGCLDRLSLGALDGRPYGIFFVIKKTEKSTSDAPVQQGAYSKMWDRAPSRSNAVLGADNPFDKRITSVLPEKLRSALRPLYNSIMVKVPLGFHLKAIGRY
jgi:SAM-dependent methyltransferase